MKNTLIETVFYGVVALAYMAMSVTMIWMYLEFGYAFLAGAGVVIIVQASIFLYFFVRTYGNYKELRRNVP